MSKSFDIFKFAKKQQGGYIEQVVRHLFAQVKNDGDNLLVLNPHRDDKSFGSFVISKKLGMWKDFGDPSGRAKGGDLISLWAYVNQLDSQMDAAKAMLKYLGVEIPSLKRTNRLRYPYLGEKGKRYGEVLRSEYSDGSKSYYVINADGRKAAFYDENGLTPLYNLNFLLDPKKTTIFIVEGEKAADLGHKVFAKVPTAQFTCWASGSNNWKKANFAPILKKKIILIPDNDGVGRKAMLEVGAYLKGLKAEDVSVVSYPTDSKPEKWDIGDLAADTPASELADWIKAHRKVFDDYRAEMNAIDVAPEEPPKEGEEKEDGAPMGKLPFKVLGYSKDHNTNKLHYHIYCIGKGLMFSLATEELVEAKLLQLASLWDWLNVLPKKDLREVDWKAGANHIRVCAENEGYVNLDDKMKGRGCWLIKGELAAHLGGSVITKDDIYSPEEFSVKSGLYFEKKEALEVNFNLRAANSQEALSSFERAVLCLNWQSYTAKQFNSKLLIGWCVAAPFSGALHWRPHIALTGNSQSGKTTALKNIVMRAVPTLFVREGKTTEAGIRQELHNESLPVGLDELEGGKQDKNYTMTIESIKKLARVASSESGGKIQHANNKSYLIRSMFCIVSINAFLEEAADYNRFVELRFDANAGGSEEAITKRWADLNRHLEAIPDDFADRLFNTTLLRWEAFQQTTKKLKNLITTKTNNARAGDVYSVLLAGYWIFYNEAAITEAEASKMIAGGYWSDVLIASTENESADLLNQMLGFSVLDRHKHSIQVGELIKKQINGLGAYDDSGETAYNDDRRLLSQCGFVVKGGYLMVANSTEFLQYAMRTTSSPSGWHKQLMGINDAIYDGSKVSSFGGRSSRYTKLPLDVVRYLINPLYEEEAGDEAVSAERRLLDETPM